MLVKSEAIVIHTLRYGDSDGVITLFTKIDGLKSYLIRGLWKSRKGKFTASLFQPLTLLEIEAYHKNKGTLERLKEASVQLPLRSVHYDITKSAIVFFISELLKNVIKEEEANEQLFEYIKTTILWLDTHENIGNFHIVFSVKLMRYLGFYPDISSQSPIYFNLRDGVYQSSKTHNMCLQSLSTDTLRVFLGTGFDESMNIKMSRNSRNELLELLFAYFELHLHGFTKPKSLSILNEIFS